MKKFAFLGIWGGIAAACLLLSFVFFVEFKKNVVSKKELARKKQELKDAQKASKKLADLEKQAEELHQRQARVQRQVAPQEYKPFDLIRAVARTGARSGLRAIKFELLPADPAAAEAVPGVAEVIFRIDCEATFPQVLGFLKGLAELERIVGVKKLEISRQPRSLPYQAVSVTLATYTFPE